MSTDSETLLQVVARQVEDIHYALGLGSDEDGAPVPPTLPAPPAIWDLAAHTAPDGRKCALLLPHQRADCTSGQPGDGDALVSALSELVATVAMAPAEHRNLLAACYMCRNRLIYVLDTAPYTGSASHQFARRIAALPGYHRSHQGPPVQGRPDERAPQIRGISYGQWLPEDPGR